MSIPERNLPEREINGFDPYNISQESLSYALLYIIKPISYHDMGTFESEARAMEHENPHLYRAVSELRDLRETLGAGVNSDNDKAYEVGATFFNCAVRKNALEVKKIPYPITTPTDSLRFLQSLTSPGDINNVEWARFCDDLMDGEESPIKRFEEFCFQDNFPEVEILAKSVRDADADRILGLQSKSTDLSSPPPSIKYILGKEFGAAFELGYWDAFGLYIERQKRQDFEAMFENGADQAFDFTYEEAKRNI